MFKILLKTKKVSQTTLAKYLGISQSAISQWGKGSSLPTLNLIPKIAKILNCSIEEVVFSLLDTSKKEELNSNFIFDGQEKIKEVI